MCVYPQFWSPCVSQHASPMVPMIHLLTQKCPPPAGIGYLQLSSEPGCASWIVVKPVFKSMTYQLRLFKRTPRTTMVQLIPFILLG